MKNIVALFVFIFVLLWLYRSSKTSGYSNWSGGNKIEYIPFDKPVPGCKNCVWGDGKGGGNRDVITCSDCGNGKPSNVFAPYCNSRKSLKSDGKVLSC